MPLSVLFDVDTGVDDAMALLLALLHPAVEVLGIGTVAGNVNVDRCTENSLRVLEVLGRSDVPVARGCAKPLTQPLEDAAYAHGNDGLGGANFPPTGRAISREHAVDQLIRLAEQRPGEITLLAVGPLTNVAVALMRQPALPRLLKQVVVMGGAFVEAGNTSALAEFNIYVDPEAAKMVFEAGFDLTIVPLDATRQVVLNDSHLARIGAGPVGTFLRAITNNYMERARQRRGVRGAAMHDPLAMAIAIDPSLMAVASQHAVTVETGGQWSRGLTVADRRPGEWENHPPGRATICFTPAVERFFDLFIGTVGGR